jgi:glycosyltransferase involved in cell wall biosynthesis
MKMLFISNFYPPHHRGGYEMLCHEVAAQLEMRGHQVSVLTSTYGVNGKQEEPGVYRWLKLESDVDYYHPRQVLRYWVDRRANLRAVHAVLTEYAPDVVVIWGMWNLSPLVAEWSEALAGSKVVYYLADQWPAEPGAHEAYWDGTEDSLVGRAFKRAFRMPVHWALHKEWRPVNLRFEHVITCSESVRDQLLKADVPVDHARVVYHGIDPIPYRTAARRRARKPVNGPLRVVYVGALLEHKGVHTAIEALGRIAEYGTPTPVNLAVLGAGHPDYELRLRQLVQRWQLEEMVSFHSPIPRSELPEFLAQFDVLVMPSVYEEPQARISQEAMAAGLVLVATPTGGTKEILVDGKNGLTFEPEDAQDLAGHLRRLAEDADLQHQLARAGWQTVSDRFTISRMIDELETCLDEVATL